MPCHAMPTLGSEADTQGRTHGIYDTHLLQQYPSFIRPARAIVASICTRPPAPSASAPGYRAPSPPSD